MRTFVKNTERTEAGKKKERERRVSNEWDIGLNLLEHEISLGAAVIKAYGEAQANKVGSIIEYLLISGVEYTDQTKDLDNTTKGNPHVHVALIVKEPINKSQALSLLRPIRIGMKEYGVPRNKTWSYYGWKIHHMKAETKINPNERILYEYGTLPPDIWSEKKIISTTKVVNKFGCPNDKMEWKRTLQRIREDVTESKRLERNVFQEMEIAKQHYEKHKMRVEDIWEQRRLVRSSSIDDEPDHEQQQRDSRRKKARKAYFISKQRK